MNEQVAKKLEDFFSQFKYQQYKKGEILVRADDDPQGIFYLTDGFVKMYAISKKGDEIVLNIYKPISFFPMTWAINNAPNMYYFEAITDVAVWRAPKEKVVEFLKSNPDVLYDLMSRVYQGIDGVLRRMTYLMAGNAYSRLITELLIQVKRFGVRRDSDKAVALKVSETDLATYAGMTRETVSREMRVLKEKGLVAFSKNMLEITDVTRLEEELSVDF